MQQACGLPEEPLFYLMAVVCLQVDVQLPQGSEVLPAANKAAVQRAEQEDLNKPLRYQVRGAFAHGLWAVAGGCPHTWPCLANCHIVCIQGALW